MDARITADSVNLPSLTAPLTLAAANTAYQVSGFAKNAAGTIGAITWTPSLNRNTLLFCNNSTSATIYIHFTNSVSSIFYIKSLAAGETWELSVSGASTAPVWATGSANNALLSVAELI